VKVLRQIGWEQRMFWRNPPAAVFTFVFPLMFLLIFSVLYGDDKVAEFGDVTFVQLYVPAIVAFGIISACYTNLGFTMTLRREQGILKRKRGTPLSTRTYLAGIIGNVVIIAVILTAITIAVGIVVFGITFPEPLKRLPTLAVVLAVGAFCFSACGLAVSSIIPNEEAAPAIINVILFPLLFISGAFARVKEGTGLDRFASLFPVRHLIKACERIFLPPPYETGAGWDVKHLLVMLVWGVGASAFALRRFKWEPSGAAGGRRSRRRRRAAA
jgi:ABC-2 type transport system permease protein